MQPCKKKLTSRTVIGYTEIYWPITIHLKKLETLLSDVQKITSVSLGLDGQWMASFVPGSLVTGTIQFAPIEGQQENGKENGQENVHIFHHCSWVSNEPRNMIP